MREDIKAAILAGIDPARSAPAPILCFKDYVLQPQMDRERQDAFDCVKQVLGSRWYAIEDHAVECAVEYMFDENPAAFQRYIVSALKNMVVDDRVDYIDADFLEEFFAEAVHEFHQDILRL